MAGADARGKAPFLEEQGAVQNVLRIAGDGLDRCTGPGPYAALCIAIATGDAEAVQSGDELAERQRSGNLKAIHLAALDVDRLREEARDPRRHDPARCK
jgi:hypothetical protein